MRILVTNDDGINAEGLDVCEQIARALSDDVLEAVARLHPFAQRVRLPPQLAVLQRLAKALGVPVRRRLA